MTRHLLCFITLISLKNGSLLVHNPPSLSVCLVKFFSLCSHLLSYPLPVLSSCRFCLPPLQPATSNSLVRAVYKLPLRDVSMNYAWQHVCRHGGRGERVHSILSESYRRVLTFLRTLLPFCLNCYSIYRRSLTEQQKGRNNVFCFLIAYFFSQLRTALLKLRLPFE
jgi:hypothetical protein